MRQPSGMRGSPNYRKKGPGRYHKNGNYNIGMSKLIKHAIEQRLTKRC